MCIFNAAVAEKVAAYADKVRINPVNPDQRVLFPFL
jgi:hypothetical protein